MRGLRRRLGRWFGDRLLLPDGTPLGLAVVGMRAAQDRQRGINQKMLERLDSLEGEERPLVVLAERMPDSVKTKEDLVKWLAE